MHFFLQTEMEGLVMRCTLCDGLVENLSEHYRRIGCPCGDYVRSRVNPEKTKRKLVAKSTENRKTFMSFQHLRLADVRESLMQHKGSCPSDLNEIGLNEVLHHIWVKMMKGSFEDDEVCSIP